MTKRYFVAVAVLAVASTAASVTVAAFSATRSPSVPPLETIQLDPEHQLTAKSGTTRDGRTYGPMPMFAEQVVIDEHTDASGYEAMLPDLVPVLDGSGQSLAGYADRLQLDRQRADSDPVPVYDLERVDVVVGHWNFDSGFQQLGAPEPEVDPAPPPTMEVEP